MAVIKAKAGAFLTTPKVWGKTSGGSLVLIQDNDVEPPPPPSGLPPSNLSLQWTGYNWQSWDQRLIEDAPGASIENVPDTLTPNYILIDMPTESDASGDRVELHTMDLDAGGVSPNRTEVYYEWEVYIPDWVEIDPSDNDDYVTICQFHGNNNAGYTGGFGLMRGTDEIHCRVEGGYRLDSNNYEHEDQLVVGTINRNTWHKIGYHVFWDMTWEANNPVGFARPYLDDILGETLTNVPTMGEITHDGSANSNRVMFRLGWYPEVVGPTGLQMRVRNARVYS